MRTFLRCLALAVALTCGFALLPTAAPRVAEAAVQINVWPALGTTVTLADGITTVTSSGAVLTYTSEVAELVRRGQLVTYNPSGGSTIIDYPTSQIDTGSVVSVASLNTRAGTFQGQVVVASYYDTGITTGGGSFRWDGAATAAANGCTSFGNSTVGRWYRIYSGHIDVHWCGATGNGTTEEYPAIHAAQLAAQASGEPIYVPSGTYLVSTQLHMIPSSYTGSNGKGPRIYGDGILSTIFKNGVANGALFDVDSSDDSDHSPFLSTIGVEFHGFSIRKATSAPANSTGIRVRTAYHVMIDQVHIDDMSGNGIEVLITLGDLDGSVNVVIENSRIENCDKWGIKADGDVVGAVGVNEISFLTIRNTFMQANGTHTGITSDVSDGAIPPATGSMIWKGQFLTMVNSGFTLSENVALYIKGQAGLAIGADLSNVTIENTIGRGLYVTGVAQLKARNLQFHQTVTSYKATSAIEIDGLPIATQYLVRNVDIDGVVIRVGSHNSPYTAFSLVDSDSETAPDLIRVRNVYWQQFSDTTQTRFSGFYFDPVPQQNYLQTVTSQILRFHPIAPGRGNKSPLRLRGTGSTSGEWIATSIAVNGEALAPTTGSGPEVPATDLEGAALAASTRYYIYLWDDANVRRISFSTTAPSLDTTHGYYTRTGDATRLYVGSAITTSAATPNIRLETTGTGWLNPTFVAGTQTGTDAYVWTDVNGTVRMKTTAPTSDTDGFSLGRALTGTDAWNPASLGDGAAETNADTITVTGAALGDPVTAGCTNDTQGLRLFAWVSSTNTVKTRLENETGGTLDIDCGTVAVRVTKAN